METSRTFLVILQDFRKKRQNFVDNPIIPKEAVHHHEVEVFNLKKRVKLYFLISKSSTFRKILGSISTLLLYTGWAKSNRTENFVEFFLCSPLVRSHIYTTYTR